MKKQTITLNKTVGQTPLECLNDFRRANTEYQDATMAYAGRLDPMAEGKLLVLVDDSCKERDRYLGLDKEYEFEVLLGIESDTYDILGITTNHSTTSSNSVPQNKILNVLKKYRGKQSLSYPVFSSKTVQGKPLFLWALEERLDEIEIPTKDVMIHALELVDSYELSPSRVLSYVDERIAQVTPVQEESKELGRDFRREEVLDTWNTLEEKYPDHLDRFLVIKLRCVCSSGTYMRTLAHLIGKDLGCGGLAWSIKRTKIGEYQRLISSWGYWKKEY